MCKVRGKIVNQNHISHVRTSCDITEHLLRKELKLPYKIPFVLRWCDTRPSLLNYRPQSFLCFIQKVRTG